MSFMKKIAGTTYSTFQLGIGSVAVLLKWTAALVSFRNKADTNYVKIASGAIDVYDSAGTNKTTVGFATGAGADRTVNLPPTAGTAGQAVITDGAGNWSYQTITTAASISVDTTNLAFGTASPLTLFTLPANAVIDRISIVVDTAFTGTPTVSVGIAGTTSKYVSTGDVDLTTAGEYEISPGVLPVGTTEALIATYSAGGAGAGAARILVFYSVPT